MPKKMARGGAFAHPTGLTWGAFEQHFGPNFFKRYGIVQNMEPPLGVQKGCRVGEVRLMVWTEMAIAAGDRNICQIHVVLIRCHHIHV